MGGSTECTFYPNEIRGLSQSEEVLQEWGWVRVRARASVRVRARARVRVMVMVCGDSPLCKIRALLDSADISAELLCR
jgi:hypothetical protein